MAIHGFKAQLNAHYTPNDNAPLAQNIHMIGLENNTLLRKSQALAQQYKRTGHLTLDFTTTIPTHQGLGSGTQHALLCAHAIIHLCQLPITIRKSTALMGRGQRSGIGIASYEQGGFIIDNGIQKNMPHVPPTPYQRITLPTAWRVLLILAPHQQGVHGHAEKHAFHTLNQQKTQRLTHNATQYHGTTPDSIIQSITQKDFATFSRHIGKLQHAMSSHFAFAQNHRPYASTKVAHALHYLQHQGIQGYGQSSWGPTGFAFFPHTRDASRTLHALQQLETSLTYRIVSPCAHGATLTDMTAHTAYD